MIEKNIPWWLCKSKDRANSAAQTFDYTVISLISRNILNLLRENLVPGLIQSQDNIGLCSPADHSDTVLGVYLYDVRENGEIRESGMQPVDRQYMQFPPIYLDLYYMVTTYLTMDLRYRWEEEHRILGGVMQLFHDNPILEPSQGDYELNLELENMDLDGKLKIWSGFGSNYQLSLFYKVSPVKLESSLFKKVTRVKEIRIDAVNGESL